MSMATSSRQVSRLTTSSPSRSRMPRTPAAARPMARTSSSLNRMAWPSFDNMRMSSPPLVGMTFTSSSPSRRLIAMSPVRRDESYSLNFVFLTCPFLVAKKRNRFVS